jgi:hypothetical protein
MKRQAFSAEVVDNGQYPEVAAILDAIQKKSILRG